MNVSRRSFTAGGLLFACGCARSSANSSVVGGCVYSQSAESARDLSADYPGLSTFGFDPTGIALSVILIELAALFEIQIAAGVYDDSDSCEGNALADPRVLFPAFPNAPFKSQGTLLLGRKLLGRLAKLQYQTAAIAAVCAHEFGHHLQFKYLPGSKLENMRAADGSVVRIELFADFVSGYHAGLRMQRQDDYPGVIQIWNQYKAGDLVFGDGHHGTPEERGRSAEAGFQAAKDGRLPPEQVVARAWDYVSALTPEKVHGDACRKS